MSKNKKGKNNVKVVVKAKANLPAKQTPQVKTTVNADNGAQADNNSIVYRRPPITKAKKIGVKGTMVFRNMIAYTSFATRKKYGDNSDANVANIEKLTDWNGQTIPPEQQARLYSVARNDDGTIKVTQKGGYLSPDGKAESTILPNPVVNANTQGGNDNIGKDYIGIKDKVEEEFFDGKPAFEGDNIHVQIAYNILDIKRIIGLYIHNILYSLDNLRKRKFTLDENGEVVKQSALNKQLDEKWGRDDAGEQKSHDPLEDNYDLVGKITYTKRYEKTRDTLNNKNDEYAEKFFRNTSAFLRYYGDVFVKYNKGVPKFKPQSKGKQPDEIFLAKKNAVIQKNIAYNYDILRLLSFARQSCFHVNFGATRGKANYDKILAEYGLFNIEDVLQKIPVSSPDEQCQNLLQLLSSIYKSGLSSVDDNNFVKNSKNNLYILSEIYKRNPEQNPDLLTERYYKLTICNDELNCGINIRKLRENIVKQHFPEILDEKYNLELTEQESSWITCRSKFYTILNYILYYTLQDKHADIIEDMIARLRYNGRNEQAKNKIYLDYAEKVWTIIEGDFRRCQAVFEAEIANKFQGGKDLQISIADKEYVVSKQKAGGFAQLLFLLCKFLDGKESNELLCAIINKLENISDLTELCKQCGNKISFAEQYKFFDKAKEVANQVRVVKRMSAICNNKKKKGDIKKGEGTTEDVYADAYLLMGSKLDKNILNSKDWQDKRIRSFISNNVIQSKWFAYVTKYMDPEKCNSLMRNKYVLSLVLNDIPPAQITRYYKAIAGKEVDIDVSDMREYLVKKLREFRIGNKIEEVTASRENYTDSRTGVKETSRALVRLYLTVAYIFVKSMVKVNTRFNIAFSMAERDGELLMGLDIKDNKVGYLRLTKHFLQEDKKIYDDAKEKLFELKKKIDKLRKKAIVDDKFEYESLSDEDKQNYKSMRREQRALEKKTQKAMHFSLKSYDYISANVKELECLLEQCEMIPDKKGKKNEEQSDAEKKKKIQSLFVDYRNDIAHLNVIADMEKYLKIDDNKDESVKYCCKEKTYYGMFCYCLQQHLLGEKAGPGKFNKGKISEIMKKVRETGTCSKDLMWLINLPFAYNLPRYKNLSNEILFNERDKGIPCVKDEKGEYKPLKDKKATDILKAEF